MTLAQRIKEIAKHVNIRHYHRKLGISNSKPFYEASTARPSVMQDAFSKAIGSI